MDQLNRWVKLWTLCFPLMFKISGQGPKGAGRRIDIEDVYGVVLEDENENNDDDDWDLASQVTGVGVSSSFQSL